MLFIVFDIEIVFLYPWAQSARSRSGVFGLVEIVLFIVTVGVRLRLASWRPTGTDDRHPDWQHVDVAKKGAGQWVWKRNCPAASC